MNRRLKFIHIIISLLLLGVFVSGSVFAAEMLDMSDCVIVAAKKLNNQQAKYVSVLKEEIGKRMGVEPAVSDQWLEDKSVIAVGVKDDLKKFAGPLYKNYKKVKIGGAEGFAIFANKGAVNSVMIIGEDDRGMLYGIGWFLR